MVIYENEEIKIKNLITKIQADERMNDSATTARTEAWSQYLFLDNRGF